MAQAKKTELPRVEAVVDATAGETVEGIELTLVTVAVKKPHTHRRRAGMAFGQQPQTISVTADVLDVLKSDPLLMVKEAVPAPGEPEPLEN